MVSFVVIKYIFTFKLIFYFTIVEDMDITGLSLHQAKRLEMEAQVKVLELEQALETERLKLSALRRYHYQMSGEYDSIKKN